MENINEEQSKKDSNESVPLYKIETNEKSPIKLPPNYTTKLEIEKKIIDLINENDPKWKMKLNKNGCQIFGKPVPNSLCVMLKGVGIINYPFAIVHEAMTNPIHGKKWNSVFYNMEETDIVNVDNHQESLFYMKMKCPFPLSDRDYVQKRYLFPNYAGDKNCSLTLWHSVVSDKYPVKDKKLVRAEMMMNAQYLKAVGEKATMIIMINFTDIKINDAVQAFVNLKSPGHQAQYIIDLRKGCADIKL